MIQGMPHDARSQDLPETAGDCPICCGTGVEPYALADDGQSVLTRGCFWCMGSGWAGELPAPCPCCGRPSPVVEGEPVCPDCVRWETADPRYDDFDLTGDGETD